MTWVGLLFCSMLLITGALWSHDLFAIWWTWNAVLTTALLLWAVYMSYLILRHYSNPGQTPTLAAVLAIFAFLDLHSCVLLCCHKESSDARVRRVLAGLQWRIMEDSGWKLERVHHRCQELLRNPLGKNRSNLR